MARIIVIALMLTALIGATGQATTPQQRGRSAAVAPHSIVSPRDT